jgi:transcriptional regulator with XRE-family HTH domain
VPKVTLENLGQVLRQKRGDRGMRDVASEIGTSLATLSRVESGKIPDIDTFTKICKWMKLDAGKVLGTSNNNIVCEPALPSIHMRADRNLSPRTAGALAELIIEANAFFADT